MYTLETPLPLLETVKKFFPESSNRTLLNWIKWGRVLINGIPEKKAHTLIQAGHVLSLQKKEPMHKVMGIPILYEDRWLIVINKPAGLLSVPAENEAINALHLLKAGFKSLSILPVHRLDRDTSGVLLFARSKLAEEKLSLIFLNHEIEREYVAIIEGHLPSNSGTWENYLREREDYSVEVTSPDLGKKAITHYQVLHRSKKFSFLRLRLHTGRKHQIRVQAANAGHPILGDKFYGSRVNPFKRFCLHAYSLALIHPFTQKKLMFSSLPSQKVSSHSKPFPFPVKL